ncbi:hypothetical protein PENARI_c051G09258 [Penicillium arizonense]|uniref:RNase H type-1 domain-containing protein n=1 Tax=Penicillium arizonense TaxID=1835702 RepID=A0A1F5L263_PENAI|nr:hypothetical protein PENARI_c051G09258 [Penicillium arizonense]OGE47295.1 hypothetical protein PENARI_c051G09258 [Penicillium arizonense]
MITIFTDNQAAIRACASPGRSSGQQFLRRIIRVIDRLRSLRYTVRIPWVPGHAGVCGNERADVLARQAATEEGFLPTKILASTCRTRLRERAAADWKRQWATSEHGALARRLFSEPTKEIFAMHKPLRRAGSAVLTQMQSGKIALASYLSTIQRWREDALEANPLLRDPAQCSCQKGAQDVQHVLLRCPRFAELRFRILGLIRDEEPWTVWLTKPDSTAKAIQFMMQTTLLGQFGALPTTYQATRAGNAGL